MTSKRNVRLIGITVAMFIVLIIGLSTETSSTNGDEFYKAMIQIHTQQRLTKKDQAEEERESLREEHRLRTR